jgi:hypothetical protein
MAYLQSVSLDLPFPKILANLRKGTDKPDSTAQHERGASRRQAIMKIDFPTWKKLITAFEITEPLIPHRDEEVITQVGGTGWYT